MNTVPQHRSVKLGAYFFGFLSIAAYLIQIGPALFGRHMDQRAAPGIAVLSAVFFYCLWTYRGRKGWEGALVGLGVWVVVWVAGNFLSGINPAP
jgi:hypothetical protein